MATSFSHATGYPVCQTILFELISRESFLIDNHLAQGNVTAEVVVLEKTSTHLIQQVRVTEYTRTFKGSVDRSSTEPAVTHYEWNLASHQCNWHYEGPFGKRIAITGHMRVDPVDEHNCRLESSVEVIVKIPIIGRMIEKRIASEIKTNVPTTQALVTSHIETL